MYKSNVSGQGSHTCHLNDVNGNHKCPTIIQDDGKDVRGFHVEPEIHFCIFNFEDVESTKKILKLNNHNHTTSGKMVHICVPFYY